MTAFDRLEQMAKTALAGWSNTITERDALRVEVARLRAVIAERDQTIEDLALGSSIVKGTNG